MRKERQVKRIQKLFEKTERIKDDLSFILEMLSKLNLDYLTYLEIREAINKVIDRVQDIETLLILLKQDLDKEKGNKTLRKALRKTVKKLDKS